MTVVYAMGCILCPDESGENENDKSADVHTVQISHQILCSLQPVLDLLLNVGVANMREMCRIILSNLWFSLIPCKTGKKPLNQQCKQLRQQPVLDLLLNDNAVNMKNTCAMKQLYLYVSILLGFAFLILQM